MAKRTNNSVTKKADITIICMRLYKSDKKCDLINQEGFFFSKMKKIKNIAHKNLVGHL